MDIPRKLKQELSIRGFMPAFDFQENVTASISKTDYMKLKEELSFDQLCNNLGMVFIRFISSFRKGEPDRIVYWPGESEPGITS